MDFSIIIAHRDIPSFECSCSNVITNTSAAGPMGLWATIHSIDFDLADSKFEYEYCIVTNGSDKIHPDTKTLLEYLKKIGKLGFYKHIEEPLSPPSARQLAADNSKGKYLFFFDSHIMVKHDYFERAIQQMEKYNMDMLHSSTKFFLSEPIVYHYKLTLQKNFWADGLPKPNSENTPYRIAAGGHGGFIVKRDVFKEVGGYWDGFKGYGGEEIYFDLKMALLGKTNWIDPLLIHYHYAGNRGYPRHYTDDFYVNMMSCANIIGGAEWLDKVYNSFSKNYSKINTGKTMFDLIDKALEISTPHAKELDAIRLRSLDEQLEYFEENKIAFKDN